MGVLKMFHVEHFGGWGWSLSRNCGIMPDMEDQRGKVRAMGSAQDDKPEVGKMQAGSTLEADVARHLEIYFRAHGADLPASGLYERFRNLVDRPLILQALRATGGNQMRAAELLGLNRNTLRKKIAQLQIRKEEIGA